MKSACLEQILSVLLLSDKNGKATDCVRHSQLYVFLKFVIEYTKVKRCENGVLCKKTK